MKKAMCLMMAFVMVLGMTACAPAEDTTITTIKVVNYDGGVGGEWLDAAAKRFEEANAETSFAPGKTGVHVKVDNDSLVNSTGLQSSGYMMFFEENSQLTAAVNMGNIMAIDDIVEELGDKIDPDIRGTLKGQDGHYYSLPHYEFWPGASYDVSLFEDKGLYLADSSDETYDSALFGGELCFTSGKDGDPQKTCGPDGIRGTNDDGLPSSLKELGILCEYMKSRKSVTPFQMAGQFPRYSNYFQAGLWTALAGYDEMRMIYTFDGEIEAVTGITDENLFPGIDYVKKPITEKVKVSEGNGYRVFDSVNRYYASAFMKIISAEGWLGPDAKDSSVSHTGAQSRFITGAKSGEPKGILMEGSYWYNESELAGNFDNYFTNYAPGETERRVAWMSLPTSLDTTTTEGAGEPITVVDDAMGMCYINNNISYSAELTAACKAFLKFLFTDEELAAFTESTGVFKAGMKYSIDDAAVERFPYYKQTVAQYRKNGKVVWCGADNATFRASGSSFCPRNLSFTMSNLTVGGVTRPASLSAYNDGCSVWDVFSEGRLTKADWASICKVEVI